MNIIFEVAINLAGFILGILIARFAYNGYVTVGSPTLLRLLIAFTSISAGFIFLILRVTIEAYEGQLLIIGLALQASGYFFLAFSHSLQSLTFKHMAPAIALVSIALSPLFVIPGNSIEHIIRSISFILLVYGATQTIVSYMWSKKMNTLVIASGLAMLALGEFVGWYSFLYPNSIFYHLSLAIKISGMSAIFIPIYALPMRGVKVGNGV